MSSGRLALLFITLCASAWAQVQDLVFRLPTENTALFTTGGHDYFVYVDRLFEGKKTQPWQAGTYGMVRNPFRPQPGAAVMYSRLHEGIDVKPVRRDAQGNPLDEVRPIAPGYVVHTSPLPGQSNYGRYIVVAHRAPEGTIYSLYAHLAAVSCEVGQRVGTGNVLGRLGYSGAGLDKTRAHLHLEIALMINSRFAEFYTGENKHGNFNGLNLIGIDPAAVLRACKNGNSFSLSKHFATLKEHYRVAVPCLPALDILRRYPFLYKGSRTSATRPESLEIAFTAEGVPIGIYPSARSVQTPHICACKPMPTLQQNCTVNRVKNSSTNAALTRSGMAYINQYLWHGEPGAAADSTTD